jgi:hypothetical protein
MMKQTVEHGGDRGAIAEQFASVFHRAVGGRFCCMPANEVSLSDEWP